MHSAALLLKMNDLDDFQAIGNSFNGYACTTYFKNDRGKYISCNDTMANLTGSGDKNAVVGLGDFDLISSSEAEMTSKNDAEVIASKRFKVFIEPFQTKLSEAMVATSIKVPMLGKTNKIIGVAGLSIIQTLASYIQVETNQYGLSKRQLDCLLNLARGKSYKEIAKTLHLSPRTVEHYFETIRLKLKCNSRAELIEKAFSIDYIRFSL